MRQTEANLSTAMLLLATGLMGGPTVKCHNSIETVTMCRSVILGWLELSAHVLIGGGV